MSDLGSGLNSEPVVAPEVVATRWYGLNSHTSRVFGTVGVNALLAAVSLLTSVLGARLLGPDQRGELAAIQVWVALAGTVATAGFLDAITFRAGQIDDTGDVARSTLAVGLLSLTITLPAFWFAIAWNLSELGPRMVVVTQAATSASVVGLMLAGALIAQIRADNRIMTWNLLRLAVPLAWLGVLLFGVVLHIASAAVLALANSAVQVAVGSVMCAALLARVRPRGRVRREMWPRQLRYAIPLSVSAIPQQLNLRLDLIVLASVVSPATLGVYAVAASMSSALMLVSNGFAAVLFPSLAAARNSATQTALFRRHATLSLTCNAVIAIVVGILAPMLVPVLFGAQFLGASELLQMLLFAGFIASINEMLEARLKGLGRPAPVLIAECLGACVLVICASHLVRNRGTVGVIIALFAARAATLLALGVLEFRPIRRRFRGLSG